MALWICMIFTSSSFFCDVFVPFSLISSSVTLLWFFSAWNCWECLSLFDILENSFRQALQILLSATFLWFLLAEWHNFKCFTWHNFKCFTMLYLYFAVVAQPAVWQWNNFVSSLKLISGSVLFSGQYLFSF